MPGRIRVLDAANRSMQRLGYLKILSGLVNETNTSNLVSLGKKLIERAAKRVRVLPPFDEHLRSYVKKRLTDRIYNELRKAIATDQGESPISLEIQDLYLSDSALPSRTGKLVEADWRRYPYLGTALELIKKGTYSALTRSLVLLAVTPSEELLAFNSFDQVNNPFRISDKQACILLYCLIDNDADVLCPFIEGLLIQTDGTFDERQAGDQLPAIFRKIISKYNKKSITASERDRLALLAKSAGNVEKWKGKSYTGGGAREGAVRVRLEPLCDLGLLAKPDQDRYEYRVTDQLKNLFDQWQEAENTDTFLAERFFSTFGASRGIQYSPASVSEAAAAFFQAGEKLKSELGYTPITDVGLLAGTRLLIERGLLLELSQTTELLKSLQKEDPTFVRFTVDRMGSMAHVKFLKPAPESDL